MTGRTSGRTKGMTKRMRGTRVGLFAVCAAILGIAAANSPANVVALKDYSTVAAGGNLDTVFSSAISGGTITVYAGATADARLTTYTNTSMAFWYNYGTSTTSAQLSNTSWPSLIRFDLSLLPGFGPGAIVNKAQLRVRFAGGNSGIGYGTLAYVVTQDWSEGNKAGGYPGASPAAPGVSQAHPNGLNTSTNQNADGSPGTVNSGSWGVGGNAQWNAAVDTAPVPNVVAYDLTTYGGFPVWTVTDIVNSWAQGTVANRGFCVPRTTGCNYTFYFSEYGATNANYEPVLFIDYTPVPEPVTLALAATVVSVALMRRRR